MKHFVDSFNYAITGVVHGLKTQRNMQVHLLAAAVVLFISFNLKLERIELLSIAFAITLVLIAEMLNTSIENMVNMISPEVSSGAKTAKDIGAGAVLIAAINAIIVGYTVIYNHIPKDIVRTTVEKTMTSSSHLSFSSLLLVIIVVVVLKAYTKKGTYLYGGMPSGHTAVAFSIWTAIAFISQSLVVTSLVLILTLIVAIERIRVGAHTFLEVFFGAAIGILTTVIIFQWKG
ncbi:MAG: diacylglycerol kinase [bacterium]|nr:diacylglycerol kinase [bacterium]